MDSLAWLLDLHEIKPATFYTMKLKYKLCDYIKPILNDSFRDFYCEDEASEHLDSPDLKSEVFSGSPTSLKNILHFG